MGRLWVGHRTPSRFWVFGEVPVIFAQSQNQTGQPYNFSRLPLENNILLNLSEAY